MVKGQDGTTKLFYLVIITPTMMILHLISFYLNLSIHKYWSKETEKNDQRNDDIPNADPKRIKKLGGGGGAEIKFSTEKISPPDINILLM